MKENPLHLFEYRQAFLNSNLILDFGYTEGYKKTLSKKAGEKSHFFLNLLRLLEVKIIHLALYRYRPYKMYRTINI